MHLHTVKSLEQLTTSSLTTNNITTMDDLTKGFAAPPDSGKFSFGKPGDVIRGVLKERKPFEGQFGPTTIYTIEADAGFYHPLDADGKPSSAKVEVTPGQSYGVFAKNTFEERMNTQAHIGQRVVITYVEDRKSKNNGKNYKFIEALLDPSFDPDKNTSPFE